ncbi:MAG: hypothetical protein EXR75_09415 [Myxococcales bacterium]|nr:hypothetical protein [Myxococcales bacterium]
MSKGSAILGFILSFIGGISLMWGLDKYVPAGEVDAKKEGTAAGVAWSFPDAKVPISSADPHWGSADAPVSIVLFSDYQCPYCTKVEPAIKAMKDKYGPEKLRVVWKHFPLPMHAQAVPAHVATQTAFEVSGSDAFWKMHELVFANQRALTPENFAAWATQAGVDMAKFTPAFASNAGKAKVDADIAVGSAAGVSGTPASFINGVFMSGAQPAEKFAAEIDKQLAEAQVLLAAGTPKNKIYTTLTNKNHAAKAAPAADTKPQAPPDPAADKTIWKVPVGKGDPKKGAKKALVTIVEFSEYECPFCGRVEPTIKELLSSYAGKLRVVWKDNPLPFHKRATPAAILAREAQAQKGDEAFWKAHAMLFANQQKLGDADLEGYAKELGLDVAKVKQAIKENKFADVIEECQAVASDFQAGGTPHFFINGRRISGAQPVDNFKKIIDEELKRAEELVAKGTKLEDVYAAATKEGKGPADLEKKDPGPAPKDAPFKGGKAAKVVIYEFSDFECPFCGRVGDALKQVEAKYGDKVKIVWRHKPLSFHQNAPLAHQASIEAFKQKGNDGFWKMHDKLFAGQKSPGIKREQLDQYAGELGLDMAKFKKALDDGTHKAAVDEDIKASDKIGIGGTPAFLVNGYFIEGAQPFSAFRAAIDKALKEAK